MGKSRILLSFGVLLLLAVFSTCRAKINERKPSVDLDDYIDSPKHKNEELLSTSATGYYGHGHQPYHGHHHHQPYHHAHSVGYHQQSHHPVAYGHGHHHHHHPYNYGHAQTYFTGEYGGGHVASAHVSYGTEINHGHSHQHHVHQGFYG